MTLKLSWIFKFQVSWLRNEDYHILSAHNIIFTTSNRVSIEHQEEDEASKWVLKIHLVSQSDKGWYTCHLQGNGPIKEQTVYLNVIGEL